MIAKVLQGIEVKIRNSKNLLPQTNRNIQYTIYVLYQRQRKQFKIRRARTHLYNKLHSYGRTVKLGGIQTLALLPMPMDRKIFMS